MKMNVWTYMNFYPYRGGEQGVRVKDFYQKDKEVLKKIGLHAKGSKVLFSAAPEGNPSYHLLSILHERSFPNTKDFEKVEVEKKWYYLQKDYKLGRLDIRHVLIPFDHARKMMSLVYYASAEQHLACPYCKLNYLAKVNTINLQDTSINYRNNWLIAENLSHKSVDTRIIIPDQIRKVKSTVFLKLFAEYESQTGINYFHILDKKDKEKEIKIKLLPNRYFIEYQNEKFSAIHRDTIQVK